MVGDLVIARAGHDKGLWYIIIKEDSEYVYLADGKRKKTNLPKKKRKKHIQPIPQADAGEIKNKLLHGETVSNEEIKRVIKISKQHIEL